MDRHLRQSLTSRQPLFWIPVFAFVAASIVGLVVVWTRRDFPFDSTKWQSEQGMRPRMVRDLMNGRDLVGKSRDSIDTMLGVPKGCDSVRNGNYVFWAGSDGVIDDMWLEINFTDDTVVSVRCIPD